MADAKQPLDAAGPTLTAVRDDAPPGNPPPLPGGTDDDRYQLREEIARGGGGRILLAYDRRLDRTVALKEPLDSDPRGDRLVREAKVMARLEHPAIVPVHDIGRRDDGLPFYAMKLLGGRTLREAIQQAGGFEQRIALLPSVIAVADAMAYAHAQGVVHRDLKPANVIIGEFGETAVIDWGLAKQVGEAGGGGSISGEPVVGDSVTRSDAVVGTPAYMPPEQAAGEPVNARADVYSLGALLYHVLAGVAPYRGGDAASVVAAMLAGPPTPLAEAEPRVPADLAAIAAKAMARAARDRYPTARELADDLRHYQAGRLVAAHHYSAWARARRWLRRRRSGVIAALAILVAAGAVAVLLLRGRADDAVAACARAGDRVATVWSPERAAGARAAVLASGAPHAPAVWPTLERQLDAWSGSWRSARVTACEETRVRGEQSQEALDLRMQCLDRRLGDLQATVGLLDEVGADQVDGVVRAVAALPGLDGCADLESLRTQAPLPDDPVARTRIEELSAQLAGARVLIEAARYDEGRSRAQAVLDEAGRRDWPLLMAQAELLLAQVEGNRGHPDLADAGLIRAELAAERARYDRGRAEALLERLRLRVEDEHARADLPQLMQRTEALVGRVADPELRGRLLVEQALDARDTDHWDVAIARLQTALALHRQYAPDDLDTQAALLGLIGGVAQRKMDLDGAARYSNEALAIYRQLYGETHPRVAAVLQDLAVIAYYKEGGAKAVPYFEQALAILERFHGPNHRQTLAALANLGLALETLGRHDEARARLEEGQRRVEAAGLRGEVGGVFLANIGDVELSRDRSADAEPWLRRAVAYYTENLGAEHPSTLRSRGALGRALFGQHKYVEAAAEFEQLLPLHERQPGADRIDLAFTVGMLGKCYRELHEPR
ncbi:MAG TPA: serine/threonine-protein kinase, partial [Kofleriaceae bacterium]|nr:serine/threonine-protein kinase [Kofleriaceae bacterium]